MFKNMKIGLRLALSFSIILALLIAIILVNFNQIRLSSDRITRIEKINNVRIKLIYDMIGNAKETSLDLRNILLAKYQNLSEVEISKIIDILAGQRKSYLETANKLETLFPKEDTKGIDILNRLHAQSDSVRQFQDNAIKMALAGNTKDATSFVFEVSYPGVVRWIRSLNDLVQYNEEYNALRYAQSENAQSVAQTVMIVLGLTAAVLSVIIAIFLTISITKPLRIATNLVISRDITTGTSGYMKGGSELGFMIQSFTSEIIERNRQEKELSTYRNELEDMVKQRTADLSNVLAEVKETVNVIAASSTQILAATTQVAAGTAETASSISETTATVEEVQQAAKQSASIAKNVAENAQMVAKVTQDGQKAVGETIQVMNRIREQMDTIAETVVRLSEHSQSIGGIIASVTEIADQSNLLSVNAAIEAAKAGEQGKGFAVVALEIKNMAGRSKQATTQVRNILNDVQKATGLAVMATEQGSKAVEAGVKQSAEASEAIRILAESSSEAVRAATQIVASSQQQAIGMEQIGLAMQNINMAGTETAVSMVQSEKSARNLNELGQKLKEVVEKFKV